MCKRSKQLFAMVVCLGLVVSAQAERARVPLQYYSLPDLTLLQTRPDGKGGGVVVFSDPAGMRHEQVLGSKRGRLPLRSVKKDGASLSLVELGPDDEFRERVVEWRLNNRFEAPELRLSHRREQIAATSAYSREVRNWVETSIPADPQARGKWLSAVNHSVYSWCVSREGEQVLAMILDGDLCDLPAIRRPLFISCTKDCLFQEVEDGWIVAFNRGEWGGAVAWFSTDGRRSALLSRHQVEAFVPRGKRLYAIEGLAHLSLSRGSIIEIAKDGAGHWTAREKLKLPSAPRTVSLSDDQDLLVMLSDELLRVGPDWRIRSRLSLEALRWLGGKSAVLSADGRFLYLGMSSFVGEVRLADGCLRMLLPSEKFAPLVPEHK